MYGTDEEMVLEKDFEKIFPIENVPADKRNIPLCCFSPNIKDRSPSGIYASE